MWCCFYLFNVDSMLLCLNMFKLCIYIFIYIYIIICDIYFPLAFAQGMQVLLSAFWVVEVVLF